MTTCRHFQTSQISIQRTGYGAICEESLNGVLEWIGGTLACLFWAIEGGWCIGFCRVGLAGLLVCFWLFLGLSGSCPHLTWSLDWQIFFLSPMFMSHQVKLSSKVLPLTTYVCPSTSTLLPGILTAEKWPPWWRFYPLTFRQPLLPTANNTYPTMPEAQSVQVFGK